MAKFDPYRKWLGIPPEEQPPNHYRLLGIGLFESDPDVISNAADRQMSHVRTFQSGKRSKTSQKILNELAAARICLLDKQNRVAYDEQIRAASAAAAGPIPPSQFAVAAAVTNGAVPPPVAETAPPVAEVAPPVDDVAPPVDGPPAVPQVTTPSSAFPGTVRRSTTYATRRKKTSWEVPVVLGGLGMVVLILLVFALNSSQPEQTPGPSTPSVILGGNGSSPSHLPDRHRGGSALRNGRATPGRLPREQAPDDGPISIPGMVDSDLPDENAAEPGIIGPADSSNLPPNTRNDDPSDPSQPAEQPGTQRQPQPDLASQKELMEEIRTIDFRDDFIAADRPSKRLELAGKLLTAGTEPRDDSDKSYTLLRMAWEEATKLGEANVAINAVEEIGKRFEIDVVEVKAKTLESVGKTTSGWPSSRKQELAEKVLAVLDEAVAADDYAVADQLVLQARGLAAAVRGSEPLSRLVTVREKQIQELKRNREAVLHSLEVLESQPDDPAANEAVGRYYCFLKGDWQEGLSRLAAGGDDELKRIARVDLANPPLIVDRLALADDWWAASEKADSPTKEQLQLRAATWYGMIESDLAGADQLRARQRLSEAAGDPVTAAAEPDDLPTLHGFECREEEFRQSLLKLYGGNEQSEAAVHRACQWLADHQYPDGYWDFSHETPRFKGKVRDPGSISAPNAATALALLPLLAAGNGPRAGEFKRNVATGVTYLRGHMIRYASGATMFENVKNVPSHALGTMALCEAAAMARDKQIRAAAQMAVNFINMTQNADGGWGFAPTRPKKNPDPSNVAATAWNAAALRTAQWATVRIDPTVLADALKYLESMRTPDALGYLPSSTAETPNDEATAAALLSGMYLGWPKDHAELSAHVGRLQSSGPSTKGSVLLNFRNSQIMRDAGGNAWETFNAALRDHIVATQETLPDEAGSWYFSGAERELKGAGRLFSTATATLALQVYYRNPPL